MIRTAIGYLRGIHHGALSQRELTRRIGKPDLDSAESIWADMQVAGVDLTARAPNALDKTHRIYTEYSKHVLYEGRSDCDQIADLLPNHRTVKRWRHDVLLEAAG